MSKPIKKVIYTHGASCELAHKLEDGTMTIYGGVPFEVSEADWTRLMISGVFADATEPVVVEQEKPAVSEDKSATKSPAVKELDSEKEKGKN